MPTTQQVLFVVAIFLALDVLIVWALLRALRVTAWGPMEAKHPPRTVVEPSIARNFQSFSFDWFNMGWCVHVVVDEQCLHLRPSAFLRLIGCGPMSIPWEAIELKSKAGRWPFMRAKVGKVEVQGPKWCLRLADRSTPPPDQR